MLYKDRKEKKKNKKIYSQIKYNRVEPVKEGCQCVEGVRYEFKVGLKIFLYKFWVFLLLILFRKTRNP